MLNNKKSDWIIVENTHEAIVSEELFQQANAALSARLKTTNKNTNWKESGNLFVCGYCGRKLQKSSSKEVYLYCQKSKYVEDADCSCIHEDLEHIQQKVMDTLKLMGNALADRAVVRKRKAKVPKENLEKQTETLKRQYEKCKLEKRYLYEAYRDGQMTKDEFIQKQAKHQEKVTELEHRIDKLESRLAEERNHLEDEKRIREELRSVSDLTDYNAALIGKIVDKIVVYESGRIELVMKCEDAYKRIFSSETDMSA